MKLSALWPLAKSSLVAFDNDDAPSMGAALAFYTLFSVAPLLVIVIAAAGLVFGTDAAQAQIIRQLGALMGQDGATAIRIMLEGANNPARTGLATIVGVAVLMVGATSVFAELYGDFNRIWRVPSPPKTAVMHLIRTRILSFGMILGIGFLLLVSLVVSAAITSLGEWWSPLFTGWKVALQVMNAGISIAMETLLFAMIYKWLPRARIGWGDVWIGAGVTAALFTIGKYLIGVYIGTVGTTSAFGAAGSLIVMLIWVYYAAQIFLLGAEFTWVYAYRHGSLSSVPKPEPTVATKGGGRKAASSKGKAVQQLDK